ncbi:MAG: tetratricopeptide repeat protein [Beijerinckiaceae bacterium]
MPAIRPSVFDHAFAVLLTSNGRGEESAHPVRLNMLFDDLKRDTPHLDPAETMELIWALWIAHRDDVAAHRMVAAVEAIAAGAKDLARPILDELIEQFPDWAEAWNKRATLSFMEKRDEESVADIARTLELEPRHFGAILGFAQICLRHRRTREAKAAFEIALRLNPHIDGLRDIIADLSSANDTLH